MDGQSRSNWEQGGYMDQGAAGAYINAVPTQEGGYLSTVAPTEGQAGMDSQGNFTYTAPQ